MSLKEVYFLVTQGKDVIWIPFSALTVGEMKKDIFFLRIPRNSIICRPINFLNNKISTMINSFTLE